MNSSPIADWMQLIEVQPHLNLEPIDPRFRGFYSITPDSWMKSLLHGWNQRELREYPALLDHACRGCVHLVTDTKTRATHLFIDGNRNLRYTESGVFDISPDFHSWIQYTICWNNKDSINGVNVEILQQLFPLTPWMTIHEIWATKTCPKNAFQNK